MVRVPPTPPDSDRPRRVQVRVVRTQGSRKVYAERKELCRDPRCKERTEYQRKSQIKAQVGVPPSHGSSFAATAMP